MTKCHLYLLEENAFRVLHFKFPFRGQDAKRIQWCRPGRCIAFCGFTRCSQVWRKYRMFWLWNHHSTLRAMNVKLVFCFDMTVNKCFVWSPVQVTGKKTKTLLNVITRLSFLQWPTANWNCVYMVYLQNSNWTAAVLRPGGQHLWIISANKVRKYFHVHWSSSYYCVRQTTRSNNYDCNYDCNNNYNFNSLTDNRRLYCNSWQTNNWKNNN